MPDWTNATGMQLKIVQEALLSAFPRPDEFEMMLALRLDQSYAQLTAGSANYKVAVFQVLLDAQREELARASWSKRRARKIPGNPKLKALEPLADLTAAPGARRRKTRRHRPR